MVTLNADSFSSAHATRTLLYVGSQPRSLGLDGADGLVLLHASQRRAALGLLESRAVDLIVCDLRDPALDGIRFLEAARQSCPEVRRMALGVDDDAALVISALNRGGIAAWLNAAEPAQCLRATVLDSLHVQTVADAARTRIDSLRESVQMLTSIIENMPVAVQLKTVHNGFRIVFWNKAAENLFGMPREEAIGNTVYDLWPAEDAARMDRSDHDMIAAGTLVDLRDRPLLTRHRGLVRTHMRKLPLYDAHGTPTHLLVIAEDHTEQLEAENAMREAKERYQRALDGAQDGLWEYDVRTGSFFMSDYLKRIFDLTPADLPQHDLTSFMVHPDDLAGYRAAWRNLFKESGALLWEGRYHMPDGGHRWFRVRGQATRNEDGRVIRVSGTTSDIDTLKKTEEELRRHRDDLAGLVDERTARLSEAKQAAERANRAKSEFLANMSHELRTPMHAIISFANFGVDKFERVDRARLKGYFLHIQKSAGRLLSLLNDLLDLSKLEAGKMEMQFMPVNADDLLRDAAFETEALAEQRGVQIRLANWSARRKAADAGPVQPDEDLNACWDGPRVLQVLRNLLSNAVKFSPQGSVIELSACAVALKSPAPGVPAGPGIEIRVRDQGVGIPSEELETVFDKFVQSSMTTTGAGGTGLGLAICREIVDAHGGNIRAERNPHPQPGVSFVARLPVRPYADRKAAVAALPAPAPAQRLTA